MVHMINENVSATIVKNHDITNLIAHSINIIISQEIENHIDHSVTSKPKKKASSYAHHGLNRSYRPTYLLRGLNSKKHRF